MLQIKIMLLKKLFDMIQMENQYMKKFFKIKKKQKYGLNNKYRINHQWYKKLLGMIRKVNQ